MAEERLVEACWACGIVRSCHPAHLAGRGVVWCAQIIKHYPQGWAYGDIAGQTGFFPASYVKEMI